MAKLRCFLLLPVFLLASRSALAQKTTGTTLNVSGTSTVTGSFVASGTGQGTISPLGNASLTVTGSEAVGADYKPTGPVQFAMTFTFNPTDRFSVAFSYVSASSAGVSGSISGGVGAYAGATGLVTVVLVEGTSFGTGNTGMNWTMTGSGNITVGQQTTVITLANFSFATQLTANIVWTTTATGTLAPFGSVTLNATTNGTYSGGPVAGQGTAVFTLNASDSIRVSFSIPDISLKTYSFVVTVTGGAGAFAGATGSMSLVLTSTSQQSFTLTGSGSITQPPAGTPAPTVTSVRTSGSTAPDIAQNTWIEVKGTNLTPATTPAGGVFWSNAPEFASGRMPTQLNGVSVNVNGKPAYVWWFCSVATSTICTSDQINVLTPLDSTLGQVPLVVTNGTVSSVAFQVTLQAVSPSFLLFSPQGYIVATHADYSLLGPASLFPGLSTPAAPGETIILWAVGFGLPTTALVDGSATQTGSLPAQPVCSVGTQPAASNAALTSPGLYQIALTVPQSAASGDNSLTCSYDGSSTPAGDLLSVH